MFDCTAINNTLQHMMKRLFVTIENENSTNNNTNHSTNHTNKEKVDFDEEKDVEEIIMYCLQMKDNSFANVIHQFTKSNQQFKCQVYLIELNHINNTLEDNCVPFQVYHNDSYTLLQTVSLKTRDLIVYPDVFVIFLNDEIDSSYLQLIKEHLCYIQSKILVLLKQVKNIRQEHDNFFSDVANIQCRQNEMYINTLQLIDNDCIKHNDEYTVMYVFKITQMTQMTQKTQLTQKTQMTQITPKTQMTQITPKTQMTQITPKTQMTQLTQFLDNSTVTDSSTVSPTINYDYKLSQLKNKKQFIVTIDLKTHNSLMTYFVQESQLFKYFEESLLTIDFTQWFHLNSSYQTVVYTGWFVCTIDKQYYYFQTPFLYAKVIPPEFSLRVLFHNLKYTDVNHLQNYFNNTKAILLVFDTSIDLNIIVNQLTSSMFTYFYLNKLQTVVQIAQNYYEELVDVNMFHDLHFIYVIANKISCNTI